MIAAQRFDRLTEDGDVGGWRGRLSGLEAASIASEPVWISADCRLHLDGTVSKRGDASYRSALTSDWLKTKCTHRQEFVVGGWRPSTAPGRELGSVLVGYFDDGELHYAGKVGTGFGSREGSQVIRRLRKHERPRSPFGERVPSVDARGARWVDPVTVAEVEFTDWTQDRRVRNPSLKGIREDKDAREVTIETPADR